MSIESVACAYCGRVDLPLERDHVLPRSRGGTTTVPACKPCNASKRDHTPGEWLAAAAVALTAGRTHLGHGPLRRLPELMQSGLLDDSDVEDIRGAVTTFRDRALAIFSGINERAESFLEELS